MTFLSWLVAVALLWGVVRLVRALWRAGEKATRPSAPRGASTTTRAAALDQPWSPYSAPGAPMGPGPGFVGGFVLGHWVAEHHHHGGTDGAGGPPLGLGDGGDSADAADFDAADSAGFDDDGFDDGGEL